MGLHIPVQAHADPPPPPFGGGADNPPPPPPDEQHEFSQRIQSNGSPSLLTPSSHTNEEGNTGFILAEASRGLRTTPPHAAVLRPTAPSPTMTTNSFAALYPQGSPPAPNDTSFVDTPPTDAPAPPPPPSSTRSSIGFLTSFLENWPQSEVSDDTNRWIWNSLHQGAIEAD